MIVVFIFIGQGAWTFDNSHKRNRAFVCKSESVRVSQKDSVCVSVCLAQPKRPVQTLLSAGYSPGEQINAI